MMTDDRKCCMPTGQHCTGLRVCRYMACTVLHCTDLNYTVPLTTLYCTKYTIAEMEKDG